MLVRGVQRASSHEQAVVLPHPLAERLAHRGDELRGELLDVAVGDGLGHVAKQFELRQREKVRTEPSGGTTESFQPWNWINLPPRLTNALMSGLGAAVTGESTSFAWS